MEATTNAVREKRVSPKSYNGTIDLVTLIVHAALVTTGHRYKLVTKGKIISTTEQREREAQFLLEDAVNQYNGAKERAEQNPDDPGCQADQVIQWAWLCQARQEINDQQNTNIPRGFLNAVKGGQQTLQTWLTNATRQQAPALGI